MEGENKHACSCGGCKCGHHDETTPEESVGLHLATTAIGEMKQKEAAAEAERKVTIDSVEEFIKTCVDNDRSPIDVVGYIANREDLSLSGDETKDEGKRSTFHFLRAVVDRLVNDMAEEMEKRRERVVDPVGELVRGAFGLCRRSDRPFRGHNFRVVPVRIRYAVSF